MTNALVRFTECADEFPLLTALVFGALIVGVIAVAEIAIVLIGKRKANNV